MLDANAELNNGKTTMAWVARGGVALAIVGMLTAVAARACSQTIVTSAPFPVSPAASTSMNGSASALRVICVSTGVYGTGFLHKSGYIITAAHVVRGCPQLTLVLSNGVTVAADNTRSDELRDLALVKPKAAVSAPLLSISKAEALDIGSEVGLWGYPAGYNGTRPLFSVGYISGLDMQPTDGGQQRLRWVLNAALNHGNSGGPVILVQTGEVIGVADSKLAPLSQKALAALAGLQAQKFGFNYEATMADGTKQTFSEGQVVAMVLEELRQQVQLVVGFSVILGDLRDFLKESGIEP